jgi:hypothetical protein
MILCLDKASIQEDLQNQEKILPSYIVTKFIERFIAYVPSYNEPLSY